MFSFQPAAALVNVVLSWGPFEERREKISRGNDISVAWTPDLLLRKITLSCTLGGVCSVLMFCKEFLTCSTDFRLILQLIRSPIGNRNFRKKTNITTEQTPQSVSRYYNLEVNRMPISHESITYYIHQLMWMAIEPQRFKLKQIEQNKEQNGSMLRLCRITPLHRAWTHSITRTLHILKNSPTDYENVKRTVLGWTLH